MYAIVHKSDRFPICRRIEGVAPDPVVTWNTEAAARAFLAAKGAEADYEPIRLDDEAVESLAQAMGCTVEAVTFDPYPG
ncbi:MAG: hypothetical protein N2653_14480 [Burkholderiales bacterium]|nr:hypothetical protein [Burkholderiales bacterium]